MSKEILNEESQLQAFYIDLNKACTVSDYDKVINLANKILKKYPNEIKAFHCKIIAMMQMENFDASLKLLTENNDFAKELFFEKAYCEYRLNRLDDAMATIKSSNENDLRIQELLGQILYKQELYEEALEKYRYLMRNVQGAYEEERVVNMTATITAMTQWDRKKEFPDVPENMFEICLNKACHLAALGRYDEALKKLKEAEELCMHTFEGDQDVTTAEIDEELSVIKVQEAYCLQKLGQHQEASGIYHELIKKRCGDSHVLAVAANNVVCINKDQNIFDSRKKMKMTSGECVRGKLISGQRQEMAVNNLLFQYYSNQGDCVKTAADQALASRPLCVRTALIKAAQLVKDKQVSLAIDFLETYLDVIEKTDIDEAALVRVQLSLAQLNLVHGAVSRCNEILGDLPIGYRHRFGVLGTRVSLCVLTEDIQAALDCLDSALDWYKNEAAVLKKGSEKDRRVHEHGTLLKIAANFAMRHKKPEHGAIYYEQLLHKNSGDQSILASLIAAYSRFDKAKAQRYMNQLKDEKQLPEMDVDSLESAFIFGVKHMKKLLKGGEVTPTTTVAGKTGGDKTPTKKKSTPGTMDASIKHMKRRKTRLPKSYDPSKMPDPERWLPKRERAHYRNKKSYKRGNTFRGPQGATSGATDLDASKKTAPDPTTPSAEPLKKTVTQQAKPKTKAKNKKKGKW